MRFVECGLTEQERADAIAELDLLAAEAKAEDERQQFVLDQVKASFSENAYAELLEYIAECSSVHSFHITDTPEGHGQDDGAAWGKQFVNQTTNGGYTGDEFAGTVSIPLGNGKYFQFGYSM